MYSCSAREGTSQSWRLHGKQTGLGLGASFTPQAPPRLPILVPCLALSPCCLILHLLSILACCGFLTTLLGNERHSLYFFGLRVFLFERLPPPTEITIIVLAWPFQKQTHANFCLVNNSVFVCVILIQKRYEDNFDEEAFEACLYGWLFGGGPE